MKFEQITKLDTWNKTTGKDIDYEVMSTDSDAIVISPIYG